MRYVRLGINVRLLISSLCVPTGSNIFLPRACILLGCEGLLVIVKVKTLHPLKMGLLNASLQLRYHLQNKSIYSPQYALNLPFNYRIFNLEDTISNLIPNYLRLCVIKISNLT